MVISTMWMAMILSEFAILSTMTPQFFVIAQDVAPLLEDNVAILDVPGDERVRPGWADSYSNGDSCYCDTTFDHGIGDVLVETPLGNLTVRHVCALLGESPNGSNGRPRYNDIQCGNGPPNDARDEILCPGRVDHGPEGCAYIGPKWNFDVLISASPTDTPTTNMPSESPTTMSRTEIPTSTPTLIPSEVPSSPTETPTFVAPQTVFPSLEPSTDNTESPSTLKPSASPTEAAFTHTNVSTDDSAALSLFRIFSRMLPISLWFLIVWL